MSNTDDPASSFDRGDAEPHAAIEHVDPIAGRAGSVARSDVPPWSLDPAPFRNSTLVHPSECAPLRRTRRPRWAPPRDRRDAGAARASAAGRDWGDATITTAGDAGAIRIGMTWGRSLTTSAAFSWKAGRTMFFEGPYEPMSLWAREASYRSTDVQFQPMRLAWKLEDGSVLAHYPDSIEELDTGELVVRETKATQAFFDEPDIAAKMAATEKALARYGVRFERELGTDLLHPVRSRVVKDVFDDRSIDFTKDQASAARAVVRAGGGLAPLGEVREAISRDSDHARRVANAMLVQRVIGFPVDRPVTADTPVVLPRRAARPGRLREFLQSFAAGERK